MDRAQASSDGELPEWFRRRTYGMTSPPNDAPPACSTARCCARGRTVRAQLGPATFLLDRVAEDMAERLHAVLRDFPMSWISGRPAIGLSQLRSRS